MPESPSIVTALALWVAAGYLAVISVVLTIVDVRTHRLPNRIVLPAYPVLAGLFSLACVGGAPWARLGGAMLGGAVMFGFFLLLRGIRSSGMGGGDVKLAGVAGLALGWVGWGAVVVGALAAFVVAGAVALVLLAARRADRTTRIAFGPFLLAGIWIGVLVGEQASRGVFGVG